MDKTGMSTRSRADSKAVNKSLFYTVAPPREQIEWTQFSFTPFSLHWYYIWLAPPQVINIGLVYQTRCWPIITKICHTHFVYKVGPQDSTLEMERKVAAKQRAWLAGCAWMLFRCQILRLHSVVFFITLSILTQPLTTHLMDINSYITKHGMIQAFNSIPSKTCALTKHSVYIDILQDITLNY